ncbi:MAG: outer membrane protein assembly factor BamD [Planctomycetota bacterium]|nr:outer membrane protein assembly factor BamD [Planctomycetota bacterium]
MASCSSARRLEGMDDFESAETYAEWGQYEDALELAEKAVSQGDLSPEQEADANNLAADSALALGRYLKALRLYRKVLEQAPWSPHVANIEFRLYEIGVAFLTLPQFGGWFDSRGRGVEALETLQAHYRRSELADDALRLVADYFGREDVREWLEAAITNEKLFLEYPESEWAERSLWLAGHYRLMLVYGPEYNRDEMLRAEELLELSLETFPFGAKARESAEDLVKVKDLLAEGEVLVANFYRARGNMTGERLRLANAAILFPTTAAGEAALARLEGLGIDLEDIAAEPRLSSLDTFEVPLDPDP